jgi:hypothetical protein
MRKVFFVLMFVLALASDAKANISRGHWWFWCFTTQISENSEFELCCRTPELCDTARQAVIQEHQGVTVTPCVRTYI